MPSHDFCAAFNCGHRRDRCPGISFFRFPKDEERCRRWVINTRRADLLKKPAFYLYSNCILCADHFETSQFMNVVQRNKLVWNAIPTIFSVPNPPALLAPKRKAPFARVAQSKMVAKQVVTYTLPNILRKSNVPVAAKESPSALKPKAVPVPHVMGPNPIQFTKLQSSPGHVTAEAEDISVIDLKSPTGRKERDYVCTIVNVDTEKISSLNSKIEENENVEPKEALSIHKGQQLSDVTGRLKCACLVNSSLSAKLSQHRKVVKQKIAVIYRLRKKLAALKLKRQQEEPTLETIVSASQKYLSATAHAVFAAQLHIGANKKMKWSDEMRKFALAIYVSCPKTYRVMSSVIHLPSVRSVQGYQQHSDFFANLQLGTSEQAQGLDLQQQIESDSCVDLLIECATISPSAP